MPGAWNLATFGPVAGSRIEPEVEELLSSLTRGERCGAVCFDADGTLWPSDVGEEFLQWLDQGRLPSRPKGSAWPEYERRLAQNAASAYAFAVEVMEGLDESQLVAWAEPFVADRFVPRIYPEVRRLVDALRQAGDEVWIVSASNAWLVRAAARQIGTQTRCVIGFDARVDQGRLTRSLITPWPVGMGKAQALMQRGVLPMLAVGNSLFDREMLEMAQRAIVVCERAAGPSEAVAMARQRGWPVQWV